MANVEYNGWTNYETWRVCLEFGFTDFPREFNHLDPEALEEYVEDSLSNEVTHANSLALGYALSFVGEVNFYEIFEHIQDCIKADDDFKKIHTKAM